MRTLLHSAFAIGDQVHIDKDGSIRGTVTAVLFRGTEPPSYEVQWLHAGDNKTAWLTSARLTAAVS